MSEQWVLRRSGLSISLTHLPRGLYGFQMGTCQLSFEMYRRCVEDSEADVCCIDLTRSVPVNTNKTQTIALVQDLANGAFCCGYGATNPDTLVTYCPVSTDSSSTPFDLDFGQAIYDRSTGATVNNTERNVILFNTSVNEISTNAAPVEVAQLDLEAAPSQQLTDLIAKLDQALGDDGRLL